jgi:hypothetical protein
VEGAQERMEHGGRGMKDRKGRRENRYGDRRPGSR